MIMTSKELIAQFLNTSEVQEDGSRLRYITKKQANWICRLIRSETKGKQTIQELRIFFEDFLITFRPTSFGWNMIFKPIGK